MLCRIVRIIIGDLLQAKVDLATVQQMAGHASPLTTVRYDRRGDEARRAAVEHLHLPYTARCGGVNRERACEG